MFALETCDSGGGVGELSLNSQELYNNTLFSLLIFNY